MVQIKMKQIWPVLRVAQEHILSWVSREGKGQQKKGSWASLDFLAAKLWGVNELQNARSGPCLGRRR